MPQSNKKPLPAPKTCFCTTSYSSWILRFFSISSYSLSSCLDFYSFWSTTDIYTSILNFFPLLFFQQPHVHQNSHPSTNAPVWLLFLHLDWLTAGKDHAALTHWRILELLVSNLQLDLQNYSLALSFVLGQLLLLFPLVITPNAQIKSLIELPISCILASYVFENIKAIR